MNTQFLCLDPDVALTIGEFEQAIIDMIAYLYITYPDNLIIDTATQAAIKGINLCPKGTAKYD